MMRPVIAWSAALVMVALMGWFVSDSKNGVESLFPICLGAAVGMALSFALNETWDYLNRRGGRKSS